MTSRERIQAVLNREPTDRPPADIWSTPEVLEALKAHFDTGSEDEVYRRLGIDKIAWVEAGHRLRRRISREPDTEVDEWGVRRTRVSFGPGSYLEVDGYPLQGAEDPAVLSDHPWPDPALYDYEALRLACREKSQWMRILIFISLFEVYCWLKPMEEALVDLYLRPRFAHALIEKILEVQLSYLDGTLAGAGGDLEMVYLSDDMGTQDRPLIPVEKWNEFFQQPYQEIISRVKRAGKWIFYHTDGAAYDIIERMVDLEVDIVNPIQYRCPGMDRDRLKSNLGERVVFHGAIDNQQVLPFGSPADVRREVEENVAILGRGGGYIVAPCHMIQPGTPVENILALYETVRGLA